MEQDFNVSSKSYDQGIRNHTHCWWHDRTDSRYSRDLRAESGRIEPVGTGNPRFDFLHIRGRAFETAER